MEPNEASEIVCLVDDDPAVLKSIGSLLVQAKLSTMNNSAVRCKPRWRRTSNQ